MLQCLALVDKRDYTDLGLGKVNLERLKGISKEAYTKLIKEKVGKFAFSEMLSLQKKHSKLKDLTYKEHKMKTYLRDAETTLEEKITLFKWRTRMENFSNNFKRGRENFAP